MIAQKPRNSSTIPAFLSPHINHSRSASITTIILRTALENIRNSSVSTKTIVAKEDLSFLLTLDQVIHADFEFFVRLQINFPYGHDHGSLIDAFDSSFRI